MFRGRPREISKLIFLVLFLISSGSSALEEAFEVNPVIGVVGKPLSIVYDNPGTSSCHKESAVETKISGKNISHSYRTWNDEEVCFDVMVKGGFKTDITLNSTGHYKGVVKINGTIVKKYEVLIFKNLKEANRKLLESLGKLSKETFLHAIKQIGQSKIKLSEKATTDILRRLPTLEEDDIYSFSSFQAHQVKTIGSGLIKMMNRSDSHNAYVYLDLFSKGSKSWNTPYLIDVFSKMEYKQRYRTREEDPKDRLLKKLLKRNDLSKYLVPRLRKTDKNRCQHQIELASKATGSSYSKHLLYILKKGPKECWSHASSALGRRREEKAIPFLISIVKSGESAARSPAEEALARIGQPAIKAIIKEAKIPPFEGGEDSWRFVDIVGKIGNQKNVPRLIKLYWAAQVTPRKGMVGGIQTELERSVRHNIVRNISVLGGDKAVKFLIKLYDKGGIWAHHRRDGITTVMALAATKDKRVLPILKRELLLTDLPDSSTRSGALMMVKLHFDTSTFKEFAELALKDPAEEVREYAKKLLKELSEGKSSEK